MTKILAYIGVIFTAFFWGVSFIAGKEVVAYFSVITTSAYRFSIASAILLVIFFITQKNYITPIKKDFWGHIILTILSVILYNTFFFIGIKYTSSVNAALITTTNPILTVIIATLIARERLNTWQIFGFAISFIGVMLAVVSPDALIGFNFNYGDIFIIFSTLSIALFGGLQKVLIKHSNPITLTTTNAVLGALFFLILNYSTNQPVVSNVPLIVYLSLGFLAIFSSILGLLFWVNGIQKLGVANTVIFYNLVPIFAILVSYFFGQTPSLNQIIATCLVIIGVLSSIGVLKTIKTYLENKK
jgi:drug/metabolite transporter (DMT)-like permease